MSTYASVITLPHRSAQPFDANDATLEDIDAADAIRGDLARICRDMACDDAPLQMIPFLSPAATTEVKQIQIILERMARIRETDAAGFTYQLASLFHYLETHTALARENYQWCAAVLERCCLTDTDYRDMENRFETQDLVGWKILSFKELHALEKICPYVIDLAGKVFEQYEGWISGPMEATMR